MYLSMPPHPGAGLVEKYYLKKYFSSEVERYLNVEKYIYVYQVFFYPGKGGILR